MAAYIRIIVLLTIGFFLVSPLSVLANENLRVEPEWLKSNMNMQNLVVLDVRVPSEYQAGHIPGAINLPTDLTYQQKTASGRVVEPDVIQSLLRERGLNRDDFVVVYDDGKLVDSSRVFWTLEVYGMSRVRLMDKGYAGWVKLGYPTSDKTPEITASDFVPMVDHRRIASKFSTQLATKHPKQIVVDARPLKAYQGETSTAKRFGHIPTAINIPVHEHMDDSGNGKSILSQEELKALYANLPKDGKIILYCEIGKASSINYLALRELGYNVANYDASWREWGNDFNLPIEK